MEYMLIYKDQWIIVDPCTTPVGTSKKIFGKVGSEGK